jgi:N-methylhydantoinase B
MNIDLQVTAHSLRAVAEEMGAVLIRSSYSPNIKERHDCSTALFDDRGRMITQAEHIPVHLGAMPEAVAAVMVERPRLGEIYLLNDPYRGGTHLPDITMVSRLSVGYAVTRAHHADVGGMEPGSEPAFSQELFQEGIVIPPVRLTDEVMSILLANVRTPRERSGDLRAQIAAHRFAEGRMNEICARRGHANVVAAMEALFDYSERMVRSAIERLPDGRYEAEDVMEPIDGELTIRAAVTISGDEIEIDFTGTSPAHLGNLNCPLAVARSATFFVIRCITEPDLPASGGAFVPVRVEAPEGCLVNACWPHAVVAGNTETSSRIVDVLFRAFAQAWPGMAQGQGTMNNVIFGNSSYTYVETIGGGQGACAWADGPSAVHVAMTNTLNTPIEALELAYPLRVERYALRLGSGGDGLYRGGDGIIRETRVLEDCRLSVIAERRTMAPRGEAGGRPGLPGRTLLNGQEQPAKFTRQLRVDDLLTIETPGGGGYGEPAG